MIHVLHFLHAHAVEILTALFLLSEVLGAIPGVRANGVFQAIVNGLRALARLRGVPEPATTTSANSSPPAP